MFDCDILTSQAKCKVVKKTHEKICSYTCIVMYWFGFGMVGNNEKN